MQTITRTEYRINKHHLLKNIAYGSIFIYPTDTIYGLGCDATDEKAVQKLRKLKNRTDKPFSVIAPSKNWIYLNCRISQEARDWIDKLPGPYTLILKLINKNVIAKSVNLGSDTIGVRIPDSWSYEIPKELDRPIVTTSANISGGDYMLSIDDLSPDIQKGVDFILYDGELKGKPSKLINLADEEAVILR